MSTQKKESSPVKGQAQNNAGTKNSAAQQKPEEATARTGKGPDAQRKPEANASDRKTENDNKRPTTNGKKQ
jgi:hypothetical protein